MVVAREHVARAQTHVLEVAAVEHALAVFVRNAVRPGQGGQSAQQQGQHWA